jgi:hypothetical protein
MGHLPRIIESQDYGSPNNKDNNQKRLEEIISPTRNPNNN